MQLDHFLLRVARQLVQTIDILGYQAIQTTHPVQFIQSLVGSTGSGIAKIAPAVQFVLPVPEASFM